MSSTQERIAALRAQAEALTGIADLEQRAAEAKAAYQAAPDDEAAKERHRAAATELASAREDLRQQAVAVAAAPGSTTVVAQPVGSSGSEKGN